jgi:ribosome-binding protein aMBF1 (putative translation factor)
VTIVDRKKREKLEAAGFKVGSAEDVLGLSEVERKLVDLRLNLARRVRQRREQSGLTQTELAARMGSSQSRVAKIETAEAGVSLDLSFRAFFALGGSLADLAELPEKPKRATKRQRPLRA